MKCVESTFPTKDTGFKWDNLVGILPDNLTCLRDKIFPLSHESWDPM